MDEEAVPGIIVPAQQQPAQVQPQQAAPAEATWLVHYAGTEPLIKGPYTWQPDQALPIPESEARKLIGSDNLRVIQDEQWWHAVQAKKAQDAPSP